MTWSATQYVRFESERNRPVLDLLARIPDAQVASAVDIGCGPGNSTQLLRERFADAAISGMDSSIDMVNAARQRLPDMRFELGDIGTWSEQGPFDVILANAVLQWLPDHARAFPALMQRLSSGGSLAVQMPDNLDEPAHVLMRAVAAEGPWRGKLADASAARAAVRSATWYYELLQGSAASIDIWRTTYHHRMARGAADVVEWFKGSGLRPFIAPLDQDEQRQFLARYELEVAAAYPALHDGSILLPFPRLFIVATAR